MGPEQRLAVDILLKQPLPHHQAQAAPRVAIWLVRALVDDVAKVVEPARAGRTPVGQPLLAALPALPAAGREAEDLGGYAATLKRACQYVRAGRSDRDRPAAHRA